MKAPTRLPAILFCAVGSLALVYFGLLINAHVTGGPSLPVPINTLIVVMLTAAEVVFSVWWIAAHYTGQVLAAARAGTVVRGVAPVHHVAVQRPRVQDWAADEQTKLIPAARERRNRRRQPRGAQKPPPEVPGLDAEVIALGRRITRKIDPTA